MKKLFDLRWRLAPLVSFLYAMGGWDFIWIRRFGVPLAIVIFTFLYYDVKKPRYLYIYLPLAITVWVVTTLPITLIGNNVHSHWFNCLWIAVLGWIQVLGLLPLLFFGKHKLDIWIAAGALHTAVVCLLLTLSNTWGYPTHAWVEAGIGMSFGGWAASLIEEN